MPACCEGRPRVLSLWDIMKLFRPDALLLLAAHLDTAALWAMDELRDTNVDKEARTGMAAQIVHSGADVHAFGFPASFAKQVARFAKAALGETMTYREFADGAKHLRERLKDELDTITFISLTPDETKLYTEPLAGWERVIERFPSTVLDVEEAGKALALGRNTSAVFHLMRVMEVALTAVGRAAGTRKRSPSWDAILKKIDTKIKGDNLRKTPTWRRREAFFAAVNSQLWAVKTAWRNPTMHVAGIYDDERALDIYTHVRAFMRQVAEHVDEKGGWRA